MQCYIGFIRKKRHLLKYVFSLTFSNTHPISSQYNEFLHSLGHQRVRFEMSKKQIITKKREDIRVTNRSQPGTPKISAISS